MTLAEKILQHVKVLPEPLQTEVLDFIEYLESKVNKDGATEEDAKWSYLSLSFATQGMEEEPSSYSISDIKERFT